MTDIGSWLLNAGSGAAIWWLLSSVVQALPEPRQNSSLIYCFVHDLAHALGANWQQFRERRPPI